MSDFNRDTSVAIATSFHRAVVCFFLAFPRDDDDDDDERREMMAPGRRTKERKKEASEGFFFLSLGGKRKEKEGQKVFFLVPRISSFFRVSLKFFLVVCLFFLK